MLSVYHIFWNCWPWRWQKQYFRNYNLNTVSNKSQIRWQSCFLVHPSDPLIQVTCRATAIACFKILLNNYLLFHVQSLRKKQYVTRSKHDTHIPSKWPWLFNPWRVQFSIIRGWALTLFSLAKNWSYPKIFFSSPDSELLLILQDLLRDTWATPSHSANTHLSHCCVITCPCQPVY